VLELALVGEGLSVTDAAVDEVVNDAVRELGREELEVRLAAAGVPPSRINQYARSFVVNNVLLESVGGDSVALQGLLESYAQRAAVEISPRYGTWDASTFDLGPAADDLSRPVGSSPASIVPKS
jgi:hypothetical protein